MEENRMEKKSPASESTKHQLLKAFSVLRPPPRDYSGRMKPHVM